MLHQKADSSRTHSDSHGGKTVRLSVLHEGVFAEVQFGHPHQEPHGGKAVRLHGVRQRVCRQGYAQYTPEGVQRALFVLAKFVVTPV